MDISDTFWLALSLVLIFEGIFPFVSPGGWKRMFAQLLELHDGQIRFFGLCSILTGLVMVWLLS